MRQGSGRRSGRHRRKLRKARRREPDREGVGGKIGRALVILHHLPRGFLYYIFVLHACVLHGFRLMYYILRVPCITFGVIDVLHDGRGLR